MGRVALATDTLLERTVAVKQALTLEPELLRRFARETKITARLEHPSIVPVYDAGSEDGVPFYVMRRVSGRPLSELIAAAGSFDARVALLPNVLAAAQAIAHAHARGIVHRDIKPGNILVGSFGETVVIDWGLAKVVDEPDDDEPLALAAGDSLRTRVGAVIGTPGFMSPGQLRGEPAGYAADVYALGASLYFMLAGAPPHHARTGEAMMELAAQGPPTPLASVVPNVPRELVAIVETALGYGGRTYTDASAFVEDLQRFSTGQLVAAHHYSSRERLARFVRRHRAAVVSGAVALAVIAIGATLAFRSIVAERDRADAEAAEAVAARLAERERGDQLLLTRARMLVDSNPTEALALLKDLDPSSRRLAEAHGLANGALMKGVAWGLPPVPGLTVRVELDATGDRLLQVMVDGELHIWDLVNRRELHRQTFPKGMRASWLGRRVLLHGKVAPGLLEPATGTLAPVALPPLDSVIASDDEAVQLGIETTTGEAVRFDHEGRLLGRPWPGQRVRWSAMTGNGRYLALASATALVVLDRDGTQLLTRSGRIEVLAGSATNRFAFLDSGVLWELVLGDTPAFRKLPTERFHQYISSFDYRADVLQISMASGHLLSAPDDRLVEISRSSPGIAFSAAGGEGELVWLIGQRELLFLHPRGQQTIPLPQPLTMPRLAFRRGGERLVIVSGEAILLYDLAALRPTELRSPHPAQIAYYDEDTLLTVSDDRRALTSWLRLSTGTQVPVELSVPGLARYFAISRPAHKVVQHVWAGPTSTLYELFPHSPAYRQLYDGEQVSAFAVLDDGGVVIARDRTLAMADAPARTLVTLDHPIVAVAPRHAAGFGAISLEGELVRGSAAGTVERARLPRREGLANTIRVAPQLVPLPEGDLAISWGTQVWRWGATLELLGDAGAPISDLRRVAGELLVMMPNRRSVLLSPETRRVRELPSAGGLHVVSEVSNTTLSIEVENRHHIIDLESLTSWPTTIGRYSQVMISESGRQLFGLSNAALVRWSLPQGSGPLRPRLEATNATINREGLLTWPWLAH